MSYIKPRRVPRDFMKRADRPRKKRPTSVLRKLAALEEALDRRLSALERVVLMNTKPAPEKPVLPVVREPVLGIQHTCQSCTKRVASTKSRELYLQNYTGPCGDSFCYASCEGSECRPVRMSVCDECAKTLSKR